MPEYVRITDVSPRDGLQNEPGVIPTTDKVRLVELLTRTGVDEIEVTSFVSPKWVPQLGDGAEVLKGLSELRRSPTAIWKQAVTSALVPNIVGLENARKANAAADHILFKVSVFTAASETFSQRNTNASIAETLERFRPVIAGAYGDALRVRAYISCAIACPFEGPIAPARVVALARQLAALGATEIDLADTIGVATPETMTALLQAYDREFPRGELVRLTLHLHDTFGRAASCVKAALDLGVRSFDGSVAGLGGCPYASTPAGRAPGNISTETLVETVHAAGYETGVDTAALAEAAAFARSIVATARAGSAP